MSISTNSINCGDDFIPAENGEVNVNAICLDNGQEMELKMAKLELENVKKMAKLEIENKEQKLKLQEMMVEQKALKEKMAKIEQKKEKNAIAADQLTKILEKISELEKQHENTTKGEEILGERIFIYLLKTAEERFSQLQNDQKKELLEKISEMEKQQKEQTKATEDQFSKILKKISELEKQHENTNKATAGLFSEMKNNQKTLSEMFSEFEKEQKQRKNYWDVNVCDERLEIIGNKKLIVHYKGHAFGSCSVFAKHPILLDNNSPDIFYFEISIGNKKNWMSFGFAVKQQNKLDGTLWSRNGTYAYESDGWIWMNGEIKGRDAEYSYGVGDTVGIGINSITRQIIFTKNGKRLDSVDFLVASSFANDSFHPFVTLFNSDDKIEADFEPNFKFDLTTL
ncbi:hypothetical protein niasHS_005030 [Heterodera schachtii]|uniref:B30.2/SPRY domain-containing protein n=1 Tax=Heterodera schachtii TaxID=97005 RepID=A0ABD2JKB3_HETSC